MTTCTETLYPPTRISRPSTSHAHIHISIRQEAQYLLLGQLFPFLYLAPIALASLFYEVLSVLLYFGLL